ncbi:beta-N-acetylhexosaminidase [Aestuariivirga litoralis]|uniref:beta-N-acetylhexosaminidase n=1 Tax=Aestuariivirga litoralis TaxID=2650924 RepID=A0A2W2B4P8_9HYPH|nr:beta-N-acetylhexosaminidase [Aestuariivirga litoralis]PZF75048.1 beta-N-acetylhexosaminidase [Aestuariivirga litoralis]
MTAIGAFISGCSGPVLSTAERDFFARSNPWGLILFKRNCETPDQLKALTTAFRDAVGRRNAPVFIDQEGGRVQRLGPPSNAWRRYPAARAYGEAFNVSALSGLRAARNVGRLMAEDLIAAGITANCVPVLDVPQPGAHEIVGNRAYSDRVEAIMALARAHAAGFADGGVLPVIKHIPGHGRARADSHLELPVVDAKRSELEAVDFPPFAAMADAPMAMTAHVVYTAIDKTAPATLSKKVISTVIRKQIGFRGLLMTDDLSMKALSGSYAEKTRRALEAGCDIVLHCNGEMAQMEEVAAAAGVLKGKALARAKAALKMARKPQPFDRKQALRDLDAVLPA